MKHGHVYLQGLENHRIRPFPYVSSLTFNLVLSRLVGEVLEHVEQLVLLGKEERLEGLLI